MITGAAESQFTAQGLMVFSGVQLYKTTRMIALDWQRTVVDPRMPKCLAEDFAADAGGRVRVVSMKRLPFAKVAPYAARFRLLLEYTEGETVRVFIDFVLVGRGRTAISLGFMAPYAGRAEVEAASSGWRSSCWRGSRPRARRRAARLRAVSTGTSRELWGGETQGRRQLPRLREPIPVPVARWLGRIKAAAARANAELGLLDADKAERIAAAGDAIAAGEHDDQFPIDVFQTGSGTSSNMNANEVIASLAGEDVHANDDVNMGQSSNDVFPSAVHLAALGEVEHDLLPALATLAGSLEARRASSTTWSSRAGRT